MSIYHGYQGARSCTSGPQTGARGLMAWFLAGYSSKGGLNTGIYNCRSVRGGRTTSLHGEGRAVDLGIRPYSAKYGTQLAEALRRNSKELGIQCIIWNRKIWSGSYPNAGWRRYSGVASHTDHIHVELAWSSAKWSANKMVSVANKHLKNVGDIKVSGGGSGNKYGNPKASHEVGSRIMNLYDAGSDVRWLQRRLTKVGHKVTVDNYFGPSVQKAVKAFQKAAKITVDGDVGPATIKALKAAKVVAKDPAPSKPKAKKSKAPSWPFPKGHWMSQPMRSRKAHSGYYKADRPHIKKVQQRLKTRGWTISVDAGYYGPQMEKIIRKFQREKGLKIDGICGERTYEALWEEPVT